MMITIGSVAIQFSKTQALSLFWASTVTVAFNAGYFLFLHDRGKAAGITRARKWFTVLIGTLVVVGTYADTLAGKAFNCKDCLLLALVATHGWMAEDLVNNFMAKAGKTQPEPS